jgi:hypothetical protein
MIGWLSRKVRFEQAVYGSFPFWHRGYSILAKSPGCAPEWIAKLREACPRYGEPPRDASEPGGHFALRLPDGQWMVVRAYSPGADDRGRPNAMAFHAAFLAPKDYRRLRCPLDLAAVLRDDWGPEDVDRALEPGQIATPRAPKVPPTSESRSAAHILRGGRKAWMLSEHDREDLIRSTWPLLPVRLRHRIEWATLAYGFGNRFDLMATPRRPVGAPEPAYAEIGEREAPEPAKSGRARRRAFRLGIPAALLACAGAGAAWSLWPEPDPAGPARKVSPIARVEQAPAPDPKDYPDDPDLERHRDRLFENFVRLADELKVEVEGGTTLTEGMRRLSEGLRYRGPWLSDEQLRALELEAGGEIPLAWHRHLLRFADDRPLPEGFDSGSLPWQLATLSWSFHRDPEPAGVAKDPFGELGRWLGRPWLVDPHPLAGRYPPLAPYADFLQKLPRER